MLAPVSRAESRSVGRWAVKLDQHASIWVVELSKPLEGEPFRPKQRAPGNAYYMEYLRNMERGANRRRYWGV